MSLEHALNAARKSDFKYFIKDKPQTKLEHMLTLSIQQDGTPTTVEYKDLNYIVFALEDYYFYTFYGTPMHSTVNAFKGFMHLFDLYRN